MYVTGPVCMDVWVGGWMICIRHPNKIKPGGKNLTLLSRVPHCLILFSVSSPSKLHWRAAGSGPLLDPLTWQRAGVRVSYVCVRGGIEDGRESTLIAYCRPAITHIFFSSFGWYVCMSSTHPSRARAFVCGLRLRRARASGVVSWALINR